jgi:hypothetical protein
MELEQLFRLTSAIRHVLGSLIYHRQKLVKRLTAGCYSDTNRRDEWQFTEAQVEVYMRDMRRTFCRTACEQFFVQQGWYCNGMTGKTLDKKQDSRLSEWGATYMCVAQYCLLVHQVARVVCMHIFVYV